VGRLHLQQAWLQQPPTACCAAGQAQALSPGQQQSKSTDAGSPKAQGTGTDPVPRGSVPRWGKALPWLTQPTDSACVPVLKGNAHGAAALPHQLKKQV